MPTRDKRHGEVKTHDSVDGDDERCRQPRQQEIGHLVTMPVDGGTAPAHGQDAINKSREALACTVTQCRQVRDQSYVPEEQGYGEVGRNSEYIPYQRAAKLWLYPHGARVGEEPVKIPGPPQMN